MSVTEAIANRIKHFPKGKPFASSNFAAEGPRTAVDKALSRMVRSGSLERVARGVYMRPKISKYVGRVSPSPTSVVMAIAKARGEIIQVHGSEAVRLFRLSTQMQILPTFYTSGSTREIRVGNLSVRLQHAPRERLQHAGTKVGAALSAMYYIGEKNLSEGMAQRIIGTLSAEEISKLLACKMPEWMRTAVSRVA